MPLWASYLVKAYAWRSVLSQDGILEWLLAPFGLAARPGYGLPATIITLSYLWLPYVILPIYAGLERVPDSLLEASGDLGGKTLARPCGSSCFPLLLPGDHRRHDLQLLALARRLHHRQHRRRRQPDARQPRLHERRRGEQPAARRGDRAHPDRDHLRLPRRSCAAPAPSTTCRATDATQPTRPHRRSASSPASSSWSIYVPLFVVLVNSFSTLDVADLAAARASRSSGGARRSRAPARVEAVLTSVQVAIVATVISLVLGTLISLALQRFEFFGRDAISLLVILPIALPGIITGIALNNFFRTILGVPLLDLDGGDRARHLLHRHGVQQRDRAPAPHGHEPRGGVRRPRRRRLDDVPAGHVPAAALGAARRRPARLRAELRRDHRDDVHRRLRGDDAADLDPEQPVPARTRRRSSS